LKGHGWVVNWTGDVRQPIPQWYYDIGPHVHLTAFSNEHDVRVFHSPEHAADYLQIGIDQDIYKSGYDPTTAAEIVFMGNNYEDMFPLSQARRDLVEHLMRDFGSKFAVYGDGWPQAESLMHSQFLEAQVYNSAKVAINFNHYEIERYSSDRILRILGSGCMCLSQHYPGIEKDFIPGVHLDTFRDLPELTQKVSYYLIKANERQRIARAGQELCHKDYTLDAMARNLIDLYKKHSCES
jgi:spore maturation protein CgeB